MNTAEQFEVFQDHPSDPRLIASFDEFAAAIVAMEQLASEIPGRYFVWCPSKEEIMAQLSSGAPWALNQ